MNGNQPKEYMELSPSGPSAYAALIVSNSPVRESNNLHEYEEVASPASNIGQCETVPAHQSDD